MLRRRRDRSWWLLALCCAVAACSGEREKPRASAAATASQNEPETTEPPELAEQREAPAPLAPEVRPLPPAPDPPGERAYAHFDAAGQAVRAIFDGDLQKAAPHLAWLAHHEYPSKLPPAWQPYAPRLQLAARVLARATTVGEAVRAVPALDAACGACHAALATKTDFNATEGATSHGEGAHALLQALAGPADKLFANAAHWTPRVAGKTDKEALKALQAASKRAAAATTWVERLAATEAIFGQCGSCHEALR